MVVGTKCPAIRGLTFVKGEAIPVGVATSEKRVLVLEFWATWCGPCRQTTPHLTELQHKYKDKHVYVIGITSEHNTQAVERFVRDMGAQMDYHVAIDSSGEGQEGLMMPSGARGIPHAFVVDATNTITFSGHPMDPGFETALRAAAAQADERRSKQPLPLITEPLEELMTKSIKELKQLLTERGLDTSDCVEKGDLAKKIAAMCSSTTYYR